MRFHTENDIHILTSKWVFAYFDDGHLSGYMLLDYKVSDEGIITWKVIVSYLTSEQFSDTLLKNDMKSG